MHHSNAQRNQNFKTSFPILRNRQRCLLAKKTTKCQISFPQTSIQWMLAVVHERTCTYTIQQSLQQHPSQTKQWGVYVYMLPKKHKQTNKQRPLSLLCLSVPSHLVSKTYQTNRYPNHAGQGLSHSWYNKCINTTCSVKNTSYFLPNYLPPLADDSFCSE